MKTKSVCTVHTAVRNPWDTRDFDAITKSILGSTYTLSVVLIGDVRARTLNRTHRNKDTAANVLTFPLSEHEGEIFLNTARIKREAHLFDLSPEGHLRYLLIHGCLHLKGYSHGSTMEQAEKKYLKKFSIR